MQVLAILLMAAAAAGLAPEARRARDAQDRAALEAAAARAAAAAEKQPQNARVHYEAALVHSYLAEVAEETRDRSAARQAAEAGIQAAERAVALEPNSAEHQRLLGSLCGQAIPGNLVAALKYGRRSMEALDRAVALDPKSAVVHLSRGVGRYYLPAALGGGAEAALVDFGKAIDIDPKSGDAHLWMGLALRRANRNREAREALARALQLNPARIWAKQQLEKTPAQ